MFQVPIFRGGERITNEGKMILIFSFSPTALYVELSVNSASVAPLLLYLKKKKEMDFTFFFCFFSIGAIEVVVSG
jgi:hypothetical protein